MYIMNCFPVLHFILEKDMFYTLNNVKYNNRSSLLQNQNILVLHSKKWEFHKNSLILCKTQALNNCLILRPALPEKPKLLEIVRNDLCSYSGSDIPRVSYIGVFQANYQDFLFFALSQDFVPIKNLLLNTAKSNTW